MSKFTHKLVYAPIAIAAVFVAVVFGFMARANDDIWIGGRLWEQGLTTWVNSIVVEPGQEFTITLYGANMNSAGQTFTNVFLIDELPQYTSYVDDSSYKIVTAGGSWSALADDNTSPFDGSGIATPGSTLTPFQFVNYKYTVKVADVLPAGTTSLTWSGPVIHFTDSSGAQTKDNMQSVSINIENLPAISSFSLAGGPVYSLGDTISITAAGTPGKTAQVAIGAGIALTLSETSPGTYSSSYVVQAGDSAVGATVRLELVNANNQGSYLDYGTTISIDTAPPPAPSGMNATLNPDQTTATVSWTAPSPETDVAQYRVYSNNGSGAVDFSVPMAVVNAGIGSYATGTLVPDVLYRFVVRSADLAGNEETNTTEITVSTDVTPPEPPGALVQPTALNDTVMQFKPGKPLVFVWTSSPSADTNRYMLEIATNSAFSPVFSSYETTSATFELTSDDITLNDGVYYWRLFAIDNAENISASIGTGADEGFEIDNTEPNISAIAPVGGMHINGAFTISGIASDAGTHAGGTSGIARVDTFLQDFSASPKLYWNGSAWVTDITWITATSTDGYLNWSYDYAATINNGNAYVLGSRAIDEANNTKHATSFITLVGNISNPEVLITVPSNSQFIGGQISILGTATDPGGSGIANTEVSILRDSDNTYWDGSAWIAAQIWNSATSTTTFASWAYDFAPDAADADNTVYAITARAADGVFGTPNTGTSAAVTIIKDTVAPVITVTSPAIGGSPYNAANWAAADPIKGTGADATGLIGSVQVAIKDSADAYWDGANWIASASPIWLAATSANNFTNWEYRPAGVDFIPSKNGSLTIFAIGTDIALGSANTSAQGSGTAIVYDTVAPAFSNAAVTNTTFNNSTAYVKNGDAFYLSANITDALQSGMSVASITANLAALTGSALDSALAPASYDTGAGLAMWDFRQVNNTANGPIAIIITATDPAGNAAVSNITPIIADNDAPTMQTSTLTAPSAAGITLKGGASMTVTWNAADIADASLSPTPLSFSYSTDNTNWIAIASNEANDGSFDWAMPAIDANTVQFRITAIDGAGNTAFDASDNLFTIDSSAPVVPANALITPNGGEAWKQGTAQTIAWASNAITDNFGLALNPISFEYSTDNTNWVALVSGESNDGSAVITVPATVDSESVRMRMVVADAGGNTASELSDAVFSFGLPPVITEVRAVNNTTVEVAFDKAITNAGTFANYTASGLTTSAATVSADPKVVTLTVNPLNNTAYTAADFALAAGTVTDSGNFMNESQNSITIIDRQQPQIISSKALSLVGNDYLVVEFSEDITNSTPEASVNYTLESPIDSAIALTGSSITYANKKAIVALLGSINLSRTNTYQIRASNIADLSANIIIANSETAGTVVGGATITEIVADPQQDWSSTNYTGTPGNSAGADDKFIELYLNEAGLNLSNWTIELTAAGSSSSGLGAAQAFAVSNYMSAGAGTFNSTAIGDFLVLGNPAAANSLEADGMIVIKEENGIIVDRVSLGSYNDGNVGDNAPSGDAVNGQVYDEALARDKNRTDTNTDNADWHKMRATPGSIDTTSPQAVIGAVQPAQNQLLAQSPSIIRIPLTETGSGVRNDAGADAVYADQIVFKLDNVDQAEIYDMALQIVTYTPAGLSAGKHTVSIGLRDNAGNGDVAAPQTWDFWVDGFTANTGVNAVSFLFDGAITDTGDSSEQQQISVSTYGAGFTIRARMDPDLTFGLNTIPDIDLKQAAQSWADKADLNGSAWVTIASVAPLSSLGDAPVVSTVTFDVRASVPSISQAAGVYTGTMYFDIVPNY